MPRGLLQHPETEISHIDSAQRSYVEILNRLCREPEQGSCMGIFAKETLYRDLAKRYPAASLAEVCDRDLAKKSSLETLCRDLSKRSLLEIMYRDLLHKFCQEVSHRDLAKRCCSEILCRGLAWRSMFETVCPGNMFSQWCLFDSFSGMLLIKSSCEKILGAFSNPIQEVLLCELLW